MKTIHLHVQLEGESIERRLILDQQVDGQNGISISSMPSFGKDKHTNLRSYQNNLYLINQSIKSPVERLGSLQAFTQWGQNWGR